MVGVDGVQKETEKDCCFVAQEDRETRSAVIAWSRENPMANDRIIDTSWTEIIDQYCSSFKIDECSVFNPDLSKWMPNKDIQQKFLIFSDIQIKST